MSSRYFEPAYHVSPPLNAIEPTRYYALYTPESLLLHEEARIDVESLKNARYDSKETDSFRDSVLAVNNIVIKKLYRVHLLSLEEYFHSRFGMSRAQVYRLLDCAQVLIDLQVPLDPSFVLSPFPVRQRVAKTIKELVSTRFLRQLLWSTVLKTCSHAANAELKNNRTPFSTKVSYSFESSSLPSPITPTFPHPHAYSTCHSNTSLITSSHSSKVFNSTTFVHDITSKDVRKAWLSLCANPNVASLLPRPLPLHFRGQSILKKEQGHAGFLKCAFVKSSHSPKGRKHEITKFSKKANFFTPNICTNSPSSLKKPLVSQQPSRTSFSVVPKCISHSISPTPHDPSLQSYLKLAPLSLIPSSSHPKNSNCTLTELHTEKKFSPGANINFNPLPSPHTSPLLAQNNGQVWLPSIRSLLDYANNPTDPKLPPLLNNQNQENNKGSRIL
ncbi:hypothetical protein HMI54_012385 [Coelomomyces lativittatus]|nr:hypothetical protein HMI55_001914 [Coelomomyces lativittatus]KAJ1511258.1 hypothetical protein HMI56_005621 [Coelomomyces lativittatus]KAJ1515404.1 hypothetical protein HMI54_012385 [Coelomomyces lativittatus]